MERRKRPKDLLPDLFLDSLFLALAQKDTLQRVRLGREWIKDKSRLVIPVRPGSLARRKRIQWLIQKGYKATAASLLDFPYPNQGRGPLDKAVEWKDWGQENQGREEQDWAEWNYCPYLSIEQLQEARSEELDDASKWSEAVIYFGTSHPPGSVRSLIYSNKISSVRRSQPS